MNKVKLLGAALGLSVVMAGCSVVQTLTFEDGLALNGNETNAVTLAKNNLVAQAATGELTVSQNIQDTNNFSGVYTSLAIDLVVSNVIFNTSCAAAEQTTKFTVSNISLVVSDVGAPSKSVTLTATPLTFTGTLNNTGYTVSTLAGGKIAADPAKFVEVFKNPGTGINTAGITMSLSAESDTLKGCSVKLKFGAAKTVFTL